MKRTHSKQGSVLPWPPKGQTSKCSSRNIGMKAKYVDHQPRYAVLGEHQSCSLHFPSFTLFNSSEVYLDVSTGSSLEIHPNQMNVTVFNLHACRQWCRPLFYMHAEKYFTLSKKFNRSQREVHWLLHLPKWQEPHCPLVTFPGGFCYSSIPFMVLQQNYGHSSTNCWDANGIENRTYSFML